MMQNSGVEWIGEIPKDWKVIRLKSAFDLIYRYPTYYNIEYVDSGIIEIRGEALTKDGLITELDDQRYISPDTNNSFPRTQLELNDLVMSVRGTMGKIGLVDEKFVGANITANLLRLNPNKNLATGKYLRWFFLSSYFNQALLSVSPQTTIKTVVIPQLVSIKVILPPVNQQQAIADYLDKRCGQLDTIIEIKQQQIKTLDALRQSIIYQAVTKGLNPTAPLIDSGIEWLGKIPQGWKISKLRYEISIKNGDFISNKLNIDSEYPVVGGNGFMGRTDNYNVDGDIIVIGRVGAYCGNVHYISEKSWVSDNALIVDTKNNKRFFTYLLNAFNLNSIANKTAQPVVTATNIKAVYVPIPKLSEQQSIVNYLDQETTRINQLKQNLNQQIDRLQAYKKSLIYEYVTGKKRISNSA